MYDLAAFEASFRAKSPIYYDVYQYLRTQKPGLDEQCLTLRAALFDNTLDLPHHYGDMCKKCETQMNIAVESWAGEQERLMAELSAVSWEQAKDALQHLRSEEALNVHTASRLQGIIALLKFIYLDIQTPLIMNNAVLNKVFFEEKIEAVLGQVVQKTGRSLLELLSILDNATENRYTVYAQEGQREADDLALHQLQVQLGDSAEEFMTLVEQFSWQKKSEYEFNRTFVHWSPLTIDIRDTIGCYLEAYNMRKRSDLECMPFYTLLPLLDDELLPSLYLKL